jgi:tape measure domain-containing protein
MATKDVELRIRAKDQASKQLSDIQKAIDTFTEAQKEAGSASEKSGGLLAAFGNEIGKVAADLAKLQGVKTFVSDLERVEAALASVSAELKSAKDSSKLYEGSLKNINRDLGKYENELGKVSSALGKQNKENEIAKNRLKEVGAAAQASQTKLGRLTRAQNAVRPQNRPSPQKVAAQSTRTESLGRAKALLSDELAQGEAAAKALIARQKELSAEIKRLQADQERFAKQSGRARDTINKQVDEVVRLKTEKQKLQAEISRTNASLRTEITTLADIEAAQRRSIATGEKLRQTLANRPRAQTNAPVDSGERLSKLTQEYQETSKAAAELARQIARTKTPTEQQTKSLSGSAQELARLRLEILQIRTAPFKELAAAIQKSEQQIASNNAEIRQLGAALREGGVGSREAKARILELVAANQQLNVSVGQQRGQLNGLRPSVQAVIKELKTADNVTRQTATALQLAQRGFVSLANSIRPTTISLRTFAGAATGAAAALFQLNSNTAPLGTVFRSLRGNVTATAASFLSFFAIFNQAQQVIQAFQQLEVAQNRLGVVFNGDQFAVDKELRIIQAQAKRLGVEFGTLSEEYGKFAIAAVQSNTSLETARDLFISIAEAGRVSKLSNEQLSGTFLALTQIISKQRIQSEEVVRQLGDRLPGAVGLFADALTGGNIPEFFDKLQTGQLKPTEEALKSLAASVRKQFGGQLEKSLESTTTQLSTFSNIITIARQRIGQAGFIDAFTAALRDLNQFLDSRKGEEFFRSIGNGLTNLVGAARFLAENIDLLATAFRTFLAVKVVSFLAGIVVQLQKTAVTYAATNAAALAFATQTRAVAAAVVGSLVPSLVATGAALRSLSFAGIVASLTSLGAVAKGGAVASLKSLGTTLLALGRAAFAALGPVGLFIGAIELISNFVFDTSIFDIFFGLSEGLDGATVSALDTSFALQKVADAAVKSGGDIVNFQKEISDSVDLAQAQGEYEKYRQAVEDTQFQLEEFIILNEPVTRSFDNQGNAVSDLIAAYSRGEKSFVDTKVALSNYLSTQIAAKGKNDEYVQALGQLFREFDSLGGKVEENRSQLQSWTDVLDSFSPIADKAAAAIQRIASGVNIGGGGLDPILAAQKELVGLQEKYAADSLKVSELQNDLAKAEELRLSLLDEQGNVLPGQQSSYESILQSIDGINAALDETNAATKTIADQNKTLEELEIEKNVLLIENNRQRAIELATQLALNKATQDGITDIEQLQSIRDNAAKIAGLQFDVRAGTRPSRSTRPARAPSAPKQTEEEKQAEKQKKFNEDLIQQERERAAELQTLAIQDERARTVAEAKQQAVNNAERQGLTISSAQLAIIERQAAAKFDLLNPTLELEKSQKRLNALQQIFDSNEQRIQTLRQRGDGASVAAAEKLDVAQQGIRAQLQANIQEAIKFAQAIADPVERESAITRLQAQLESLQQSFNAFSGEQINQIFTQNATDSFTSFFDKIKEGQGVISALGDTLRSFASNALAQISNLVANAAFQQLFGGLNASGGINPAGGVSGGIASALSGLFSKSGKSGGGLFDIIAGLFHEGGTVGQGGKSVSVSPSVFLGAKRYHRGGLPGLKKDEVPAILQTGEEVLSRKDPRNVLNSGGSPAMQNIKVVNTIDSGSFISEGLNSVEGQKSVMNYIRANKAAVRNVLGV